MPIFKNRYQKTGFTFSLMLSFIYLPLLLGILQNNKFIYNEIINMIVFISFTITFMTAINYKIVLAIKEKNPLFVSKFILVPVNFLFMLVLFLLLPFELDRNAFVLSTVFLGIPWFLFFIKVWKRYSKRLK